MTETTPSMGSRPRGGTGWRMDRAMKASTSAPPNNPRYPRTNEITMEKTTVVTNPVRAREPTYIS